MHPAPWLPAALALAAFPLASCTDRVPTPGPTAITAPAAHDRSPAPESTLPAIVRQLAAARGVVPLDAQPVNLSATDARQKAAELPAIQCADCVDDRGA